MAKRLTDEEISRRFHAHRRAHDAAEAERRASKRRALARKAKAQRAATARDRAAEARAYLAANPAENVSCGLDGLRNLRGLRAPNGRFIGVAKS